MPFQTTQTQIGLGRETTRGTAGTVTWIPVRNPAPFDNFKYLDDKGLRGSPVDVYNRIQGAVSGEWSFSGDVMSDTFPILLTGVLGSASVTSGATFTDGVISNGSFNLSSATANFNGISGGDVGKSITVIGAGTSGGNLTTTISSVTPQYTGAPPYLVNTGTSVATLAASASTSVSGATFTITRSGGQANNTHTIGLRANQASTGHQPDAYTFQDYFNGQTADTRQWLDGQLSDVTLKFNADALLEYDAKAMALASTTIANPSPSFSTTVPLTSWSGLTSIAGTSNSKLAVGEIVIKRPVTPLFTVQGIQSPYRLWAGPIMVTGKGTFIYEDDTELNFFLQGQNKSFDCRFTQTFVNNALINNQIAVHSSQANWTVGKITRGKDFVETDLEWLSVANSTDATAGGVSPVKVTVVNTVSSAYASA